MAAISDISLVTQVAVFRNKRAFDQLVRKYQSPIRRFLLNLTLGNEALSDDLAQDTFIKAYLNIGKFRGMSSFQTWLTRIAYNTFYDYKRREGKAPSSLPPMGEAYEVTSFSESSAPVASPIGGRLEGASIDIARALATLKEEERTCITLQLIEGYAISDIADITGMKQNTVKSHLLRGKDKLANYLKQNGYDRS